MPEPADLTRPQHHEQLLGPGEQLQDVVDESWKIVVDGDCGLVLAKWRAAEIPLIDGGEQEWRLWKKPLSMLAHEGRRGTGDTHDQVRPGAVCERGSDVVDDRRLRRRGKTRRPHDNLNDVDGAS